MFYIGQEVICVDDAPPSCGSNWDNALVKGKIYTISQTGLTHIIDPQKLPCVTLVEIKRHKDAPYWAHRFRPVQTRSTDISIFKSLLNPLNHRHLEGV